MFKNPIGVTCSYGMNFPHIGPSLTSVSLARIKRPSEKMLLADAYFVLPGAWYNGMGDWLVLCPLDYPITIEKPAPRHSGGANVLFVDNHINWLPVKVINANENDIFGHYGL